MGSATDLEGLTQAELTMPFRRVFIITHAFLIEDGRIVRVNVCDQDSVYR